MSFKSKEKKYSLQSEFRRFMQRLFDMVTNNHDLKFRFFKMDEIFILMIKILCPKQDFCCNIL